MEKRAHSPLPLCSPFQIVLKRTQTIFLRFFTIITSAILVLVALTVSIFLCLRDAFFFEPPISTATFHALKEMFVKGIKFPDANRRTSEILQAKGYPVEEHFCHTKDGYVLALHRVLPRTSVTLPSPGSSLATTSNTTSSSSYLSQSGNTVRINIFEDLVGSQTGRNGHINGHNNIDTRLKSEPASSRKERNTRKESEIELKPAKRVVLMHHGLIQSSAVYLMKDENSLPCVLADAGFDVWLANNRGTSYSRHSRFTSSDPEYWDFTWADMGEYDLPAEIDYILNLTGQSKLVYIGHSQGTTQAFAGFSINSGELSEKVSLFIAMSPAAFVRAEKTLLRLLSNLEESPRLLNLLVGHGELLPLLYPARALINSLQMLFPIWALMGLLFFEVLMGWNDRNLDPYKLPVIFWHTPDSTSTKNLQHYFQVIKSSHFHAFNYGPVENVRRYGRSTPPTYDLSAIKCPVALIYGKLDKLLDMDRLLCHVKPVYLRCFDDYKHMDLLMGTDAHIKLFPLVTQIINSHSHS